MPEHPEQVLPKHGVAALCHVEEVHPESAVEVELNQRHGYHRERQHNQNGGDERHPGEQRQPHKAHARRAHIDDGDDEVERRRQRRDPQHLQADDPVVYARSRVLLNACERRVAEPARVGSAPREPAYLQDYRARQERPVAKGVQAGERHVPRSDLQRHYEVEERRAQRHYGEEYHRRAVHREQLVEHLRAHDVLVWPRQLYPHNQRL